MEPETIRMLERLLICAGGILSIFLGYRLFHRIPLSSDSGGKIEIPGVGTLALTSVGPGVFFAAFGAAILSVSLLRPVATSARSAEEYALAPFIPQLAESAQALKSLEDLERIVAGMDESSRPGAQAALLAIRHELQQRDVRFIGAIDPPEGQRLGTLPKLPTG